MKNIRRLLICALSLFAATCATPTLVGAQNIRQLPRANATTGANDSALVVVSDSSGTSSAVASKAVSLHQIFLRPSGSNSKPSFSFALDSTTGWYYNAGVLTAAIAGGNGPLNINSTGIRTLLGTAAIPSYSFVSDPNTGLWNPSNADTLGITTGGVHSLSVSGGASAAITGGAGSMTITGGTGASRNLTLNVTNVGGGVTTGLTLTGGASPNAAFNLATTVPAGSAGGPSLNFSGSTTTGLYRFGADTLGLATGGAFSARLSGGTTPLLSFNGAAGVTSPIIEGYDASSLIIQATRLGANAGVIDFKADNASGNLGTLFRVNGNFGQVAAANGSASNPAYSFISSTGSGMYSPHNDSLQFSTAGTKLFSMTTGGIFAGGAANMTIQSGTGINRTLTFQTTNGAGSAITALTLDQAQQTSFANSTYGITGTAATPSYNFTGSGTMGMYNVGTDTIGFASLGRLSMKVLDSAVQVQQGRVGKPSIAFTGSPTSGLYRFGPDTIGVATAGANSLQLSGGASAKLIGGAGNMTILAGTGNSRSLTLQITNSSGTATNVLSGTIAGTNAQANIANGRVNIFDMTPNTGDFTTDFASILGMPSGTTCGTTNAVIGKTDTRTSGICFTGTSVGVQVSSTQRFLMGWNGSATTLTGSTGNMIVLAGTGNNRNLTLQSSNASGTATTFAQGGGDTLILAGHAIFSGLTAASGTPNTVCIVAAGKQITENAATSCVVSSARFKKNIKPLVLDSAYAIVRRLTPVTFEMKDGGRPSIHVIAEQADSISKRLSFYDAQGRVNSVDDGSILSAVLRVVQQQQLAIDSLRMQVKKLSTPR